ncbi:MAG: EamA family transporter [Spirochaetaceae bacterium]|nr:EamA family transporter [Spirochaetaceae bacterium]
MAWIFLVLLYGLLKGSRALAKKKAMATNSIMEVLLAYTILSFVFVIPQAKNAGGLETKFYFYIAVKSFVIFVAWIFSFNSLKRLPVSVYGILDLSRVLFATFLGVFFLGERLGFLQVLGLLFVCAGLLMLKFKPPFLRHAAAMPVAVETQPEKKYFVSHDVTTFYVVIALVSCLLNALSGFMDKILMKSITSSQLQFWYMLFLVLYYVIYVLVKKEKISLSVFKNRWIWLLAAMFVIGDKALFIANGMAESRVTVMTLIKQSSCLVTILGGYFMFKEKDTLYRMFCALVIIFGIVLGIL